MNAPEANDPTTRLIIDVPRPSIEYLQTRHAEITRGRARIMAALATKRKTKKRKTPRPKKGTE